jgi:hypothetical protein
MTIWGRRVLEEYESGVNCHNADGKTIARLWTDLFLDLSLGKEFDHYIDGCRQPVRSRLQWWVRLNNSFVDLRVTDGVEAGLNPGGWHEVNIAGNVISQLEAQGMFFHGNTLTPFIAARQSRQQPSLVLPPPSQTHHSVRHSHASMESQAMTAPSLVESRRPEAKTILDASDDDRSIAGDTVRIPTPELDEIVAGICSRNHQVTLGSTIEAAKMDNDGS